MRKHVLFIVHGMGMYVAEDGDDIKPDNQWSEAVADVIREQYQQYPGLSIKPFDEVFEVVHINYDSIFHRILKRWQDSAREIKNAGVGAAEIATRMVGWLDGGADLEDNFGWSHAGDAVLYHYFVLVRQWVKVHVARQFDDHLKPNADGAVTQWSVVAHSLGTSVTHDVLHAMDQTTPPDGDIPILDAMVGNANVIAMLGNVSKTLETDAKVYQSAVKPFTSQGVPTVCNEYLSCNNRLDPFVTEALMLPKRFDPSGVPAWDQARQEETFLDIEISNVHELNVHSAKNYLVNPAVHIPLFERMCGFGSISAAEKQEANDNFQDIPDAAVNQALLAAITPIKDKPWFEAIGMLLPLLEKGNG